MERLHNGNTSAYEAPPILVPLQLSLGIFDFAACINSGAGRLLLLDFKTPERNIELPFYILMRLARLIFLQSASGYDAKGGLEGKIHRFGDTLNVLNRKSCLFGTVLWMQCEVKST